MATAKKTASAAETIETWTNATPEAFREGYEKLASRFGKWADFNRESMDAWIAAAGRLAKGLEKAASENTSFVKASYEDGVEAFKAATASKSVQEALDIQAEFARTAFEKNLAQLNKVAEQWATTTKEAAEPITARYSEFVELVQNYRP